ncbi:protein-arginine deiminase family protein [Motilibacter deserti]|uniref:Protein-arginine deiminase C-terminal domain-containing protein n=1 Tax=Motilibacter deserti TaxID=2714956 RepID=A0ABX0H2G0_9ACTN|nr:hypothetical protein [Motilibacter deserti]
MALGSAVAVALPLAPVSAGAAVAAALTADTNRDGVLSAIDDAGEDRFTAARGAVMLANIDDDLVRCPKIKADGSQLTDLELEACNDAADDIVNGDADLLDLAKLDVAPAPGASAATVTVGPAARSKVRVFVKRGEAASDWAALPADGALSAQDVEAGATLGVEARDIIRDPKAWDGTVDVTLTVTGAGTVATDVVRLRVAPLLFVTDTMKVDKLMVADYETSIYQGRPVTAAPPGGVEPFREDLRKGLAKIGVEAPLYLLPAAHGRNSSFDKWTQDIMEPGYMSMPTTGGAEHRMRVYVRAPSRNTAADRDVNPYRSTGRTIFTVLRGKDVAGVQHYDPAYQPGSMNTFGSTGNYGSVPPYSYNGKNYPTGRKLFGAEKDFTADPAYNAMLANQGFQKPIVLDTSWLSVGHVDEFLSFTVSDSPRGWSLIAADPMLAENMLRDLVAKGLGDQNIAQAGLPGSNLPTMTVKEALKDERLRDGAHVAKRGINAALKILKKEIGLTDAEIVRVPVFYRSNTAPARNAQRLGAYLPDAANGIGTGEKVWFSPRQHGPTKNGVDVFEDVTEKALAKVGVQVHWVEDWQYAHSGSGEIHCVSNVERDLTSTLPWWTETA